MIKLDLHTHSNASPDGGLQLSAYRHAFDTGLLDYIAVTDHNTTDFARSLQQELGARIIVGEEVPTQQGEIIGLYLTATIPAGLPLVETIAAIRAQGGIVYVPHPFETRRKGLSSASLDTIIQNIDIVEVHNGRAWAEPRTNQAIQWAQEHRIAGAASSDAHGRFGLGRTYMQVAELPTRETLLALLHAAAFTVRPPTLGAILEPTYNRLLRRLTNAR